MLSIPPPHDLNLFVPRGLFLCLKYSRICVCVCVCVFFPFNLDVRLVGRTSRGDTGFLIHLHSGVIALIFLARGIQPFLSFVDREVEFCILAI